MNWTKEDDLSKFGFKLLPEKKKIPLGDHPVECQIYKIPLKCLKYNRSNGRIFMEINKLQNDNGIDLTNLSETDITQYNDEIENLIWESSPDKNKDTLENIERYTQLETGAILADGTVIDGNRRFTCLRRLHKLYPENEEFAYFKAAIIFLEGNKITKKDIKKYELMVQFGTDEKVDYKPINFNMSIYETIKSGDFTVQEVAEKVRKSPSDITKIMRTCPLIEEMLIYINQANELSIADELNIYWPLEPLASYLNGPAGKKLSKIEVEKRKHIYFDYILTLDIGLPTQTLRDNLIKKIFKNDNLFNELSDEYEKKSGEIVSKEIITKECAPEEFLQNVKAFKKTPPAEHILNDFVHIKEKAGLEKSMEQPIDICSNIKSDLKELNLDPFFEAKSNKSDEILYDVRGKLNEINEFIVEIIEKINTKLNDNE